LFKLHYYSIFNGVSRVLDLIISMSVSSISERNSQDSKSNSANICYQVDQQAKLINLQAEVDLLLLQLQKYKQQKQSSTHEQSC